MQTFHRFRPTSHFIPPHSWSNDPCGAVYVPETKEYLWAYQWHPGTTKGGNSAWGMAKSKDMITWEDCSPALTLGPTYDSKGVFSGSIISRLVESKRVLYLFYTSVSATPIHWTVPEIEGSETQSVAFSTDFGKTWHRYENNPLLSKPPYAERTTGWRDPFVSCWENMSRLRGVDVDTNYMMLASGEMGVGSQLMLYESDNLLEWKEVSTLLKVDADTPVAPGSQMLWGRNFECASFTTIEGKDYLIVGVEENPELSRRHSDRYTMWMGGSIRLDFHNKPHFEPCTFGYLDHGILYAPHIPRGAKDEILQLGWLEEDDNNIADAQGWQGLLTLPRELFEVKVPVPSSFPASEVKKWIIDERSRTMTTLGMRPAAEVSLLRLGSKMHLQKNLASIRSKNYELEGFFTKLHGHETLTFNVRQSPKDAEVTRIIISIPSQTITVDRRLSSLDNGNSLPNTGYFGLLNHGTVAKPEYEDLHVKIFVDNSVIEVYANDRFALSTRIYPSLESSTGVSCDFKDGRRHLSHEKAIVRCWDKLTVAWPKREHSLSERLAHVEKEDTTIETIEYSVVQSVCA